LRVPEIADLVGQALRFHQGQRYNLEAWVIMPNHVHVLLRPLGGFTLSGVVKSWKQFTSMQVKHLLRMPPGRLWQPEAYDHWVRDDADGARIVRYIECNPVKAGLCENPADWRWSSANDSAKSSADFQSALARESSADFQSALARGSSADFQSALARGSSADFQSASGKSPLSRLEVCATPCIVPPAPMLHLIHAPESSPDLALPSVFLLVERRTLAKRLWRGVAADGTEFGFELAAPLTTGATFYQTATHRYVIDQAREPVLEVQLANLPPSAAAGIGWAVGNLHLEFSSEATRLLTPDEPAARQLFARLQVEYTATTSVFRAGRFKRSQPNPALDDLGPSHKH
jgi:urease accessory protein